MSKSSTSAERFCVRGGPPHVKADSLIVTDNVGWSGKVRPRPEMECPETVITCLVQSSSNVDRYSGRFINSLRRATKSGES